MRSRGEILDALRSVMAELFEIPPGKILRIASVHRPGHRQHRRGRSGGEAARNYRQEGPAGRFQAGTNHRRRNRCRGKNARCMKSVLQAVLALAIMAYPIGVYFGLARVGVVPIACLLAALALARMALVRRERRLRIASSLALVVALAVRGCQRADPRQRMAALLPDAHQPDCPDGVWLVASAPSQRNRAVGAPAHAPAACGRCCLDQGSDQGVVRILRAQRQRGLVHGAFCNLQTWTLYNGFIAYLLIGLLLGGEFLLRPRGSQHR